VQWNDLGNLILKDQTNNTIKWRSFDHPTNTLLSGMKTGFDYLRRCFLHGKAALIHQKGSTPPRWTLKVLQRLSYGIVNTGPRNGLYLSELPPMVTVSDVYFLVCVQ
jgi:D-mannose binding lectin